MNRFQMISCYLFNVWSYYVLNNVSLRKLTTHCVNVEEKKKGRSASNYPMDTKPLPIPVDESDKKLLETRGIRTEMALLSNILETYSYVIGKPILAILFCHVL